MRNNRFTPLTLAASALAVALIAGSTGGASAADYDGDRSWNGNNGRVEYGSDNARRGNSYNHRGGDRDRDGDRGGRNHGGWGGDRDRHFGDGYGYRRHHWRGRYNPWWRYSRNAYGDRYEPPHRHDRWNRYW